MVEFHLSSASCFETHYEIFNEDGSEYDGPLYIDEWDSLTLDNPYDYVDETLYARVVITMQQPISDYGFSLPALTGYVHIINSGYDPTDPESGFNIAQWAEIYSQYGAADSTFAEWTLDEDVSTVFSATCEGEYAEVNVLFAYEVPLQTVGIKTDLGDFGSIFARDAANGEAIYCQENVELDGFHRCDMHTDHIVFQKQCDADTTTFNVAEIGAFIYAEAGAWDWISSVATDGTEQD